MEQSCIHNFVHMNEHSTAKTYVHEHVATGTEHKANNGRQLEQFEPFQGDMHKYVNWARLNIWPRTCQLNTI